MLVVFSPIFVVGTTIIFRYENRSSFNNQSFLQEFEKINWNQVLQLNQNNVIITFENYLNTVTKQKTKKLSTKTMDY